MAQSLSFSSAGAVPKPAYQNNSFLTGLISKSAPVQSKYGSSAPLGTPGGADYASPQAMLSAKLGTNPGVIKPSTPVKSVSTADGTTVTYHAPAVDKTPTTSSNTTDNSSSSSASSTPPATGTYTPTKQGSTGISQGGLISNLAGQSQAPSQAYTDAQAEANRIAGERTKLTEDFAQKDSNIKRTAGFLTQATGLEGILQGQYNQGNAALSTQEQSATNRLGAANTQQGLQQGALTSAISANAPVTQFGQLTSPVTGEVIGAGNSGNNPALDNAVANAVKMVQSGATPSDALASLSGYGQAGVNAFNQAQIQLSNGTYNPTAQNAIAGSNTAQGVNYKQQAVDLDTSLKQLDTASTLATNFLTDNKLLNPTDNPNLNKPINSYVGTFNNPTAVLQYNAILGDIKKFTSTILASNNGTIPTDVTNTLNSFDPSTLSAKQLKPYLDSLAQLGNNQKAVIQQQVNSLVPNQPNNYIGSPSTINTKPIAAPQSAKVGGGAVTNKAAQAGLGTALGIIGGVKNLLTGLASKILQ